MSFRDATALRTALLVFVCGCAPATPGPKRHALHPEIGFASPQQLHQHFVKHGAEFGPVSEAEYLARAQGLRDCPATGAVLEGVRGDGVVSRFDRSDGAFLAFDSDRTIRTFFKPNDGEQYYWRQLKR